MKRFIFILFTMYLLCPFVANAQASLAIEQFFDGRYDGDPTITTIRMKNREVQDGTLKRFNIEVGNVLVFNKMNKDTKVIETAVMEDMKQAVEKRKGYTGKELTYLCFSIRPKTGNQWRFVFYTKKQGKLFLALFEGDTTLAKIERVVGL